MPYFQRADKYPIRIYYKWSLIGAKPVDENHVMRSKTHNIGMHYANCITQKMEVRSKIVTPISHVTHRAYKSLHELCHRTSRCVLVYMY